MSYILDALRKSDQQRQRGATPTLLIAQAPAPSPVRPRYVLNGLLATVLICTGIVVGWLRPWQIKPPAPAPDHIASMPVAPGSSNAVPAPPSISSEMTGQLEHEPLMHRSTSAQPADLSAVGEKSGDTQASGGEVAAPALSLSDTGVQKVPSMPLQGNTVLDGTASSEVKAVPTLNELPPAVRQEIPTISISFHAYSSDPKERRVMINGRMAEAGESVAPDLRLEQITPGGVILDYRGFRFQQGVR